MPDPSGSAAAPLLAGLSSLVYGGADFSGGLASKRADGIAVTFVSQVCGVLALLVAITLWPHVTVSASDLWWGAAGGLAGGFGLMFFYPALAAGPMSIVAPTTALCSAIVPLVVGLARGDRPSTLALIGVGIALPAIGLVARERSEHHEHLTRRTILSSVAAGVGFGLFFVFVGEASGDAGLWPLVGARAGSLSLLAVVLLVTRRSFGIPVGARRLTVIAGVGDIVANGLYVLALADGLVSVVAVVGSMYPASTVVLARVVLGERMSRAQIVGLFLAGTALVLVALGR